MKMLLIYVGAFLMSMITIAGDVCIKEATISSSQKKIFALLLLTSALWSLSAWGWYYIMKHTSLFQAGVLFTMICLIIGSAISILWYKEPIITQEWVGLIFAIVALCLMGRAQ
jgi:small multidrug resistance pump